MSERTPTVAEMRDAWITAQTLRRETFAQHYRGAPVPDYGAEFDRGMARIRADAWGEGHTQGWNDYARNEETVGPHVEHVTHNPHLPRTDVPSQ